MFFDLIVIGRAGYTIDILSTIMGVDHGLSGRDNAKSKLRREKKAKRSKNIAKKLRSEDVVHNSKEVKFDDVARVAWLTGFRKRKQERRKYGLAMQVFLCFKLL